MVGGYINFARPSATHSCDLTCKKWCPRNLFNACKSSFCLRLRAIGPSRGILIQVAAAGQYGNNGENPLKNMSKTRWKHRWKNKVKNMWKTRWKIRWETRWKTDEKQVKNRWEKGEKKVEICENQVKNQSVSKSNKIKGKSVGRPNVKNWSPGVIQKSTGNPPTLPRPRSMFSQWIHRDVSGVSGFSGEAFGQRLGAPCREAYSMPGDGCEAAPRRHLHRSRIPPPYPKALHLKTAVPHKCWCGTHLHRGKGVVVNTSNINQHSAHTIKCVYCYVYISIHLYIYIICNVHASLTCLYIATRHIFCRAIRLRVWTLRFTAQRWPWLTIGIHTMQTVFEAPSKPKRCRRSLKIHREFTVRPLGPENWDRLTELRPLNSVKFRI